MNKAIFWHIGIITVISYLSYTYGAKITSNDLQPLIAILQNTSAMIFTIMGIWVAYVYPNAVLRIVQPSKVIAVYSKDDLSQVKMLIGIIIFSALILFLLLIGTTIATFVSKTNIYNNNSELFLITTTFSILSLTYGQLFCIYLVIATSVNFVIELENIKTKKELSQKLDGKPGP
ncbi:hypothetical protein [Rheinheimera sp.]|uniref:hypothetical protein n=1 Tax=Rheinheimera sp. TaxID=1869214 RepID=UPI0027373D5F|nr:hypothetical protein [Rheinheimera sp.]MDP2716293.1 hypothetical protein [Rheinheimera sp.]